MAKYRYEIKYIINKDMAEVLKQRLSLIMDIISVLDEKVEIRYKNIVIRQKSIELSKSDYTDCVNEYICNTDKV